MYYVSDCFYLDTLFNQTYARHNNETLEKRPKPAENTIIELVILTSVHEWRG